MSRIYNFNAGPAVLPLEVLQTAQAELIDFQNTGMSILESSHRAKAYEAIHEEAIASLRELLGISDDYAVLLLQGGASTQFAFLPLNFASKEHPGSYVLSGSFAEKAYKEAEHLGIGEIVASSKEGGYRHIPTQDELKIDENAAYVHLCYNNTIYGTEYHYIPDTKGVPLFADMSSDMLSRPIDFSKFDFIYAGVQKNLGPAGVTLVVAKKSFLEKSPEKLPTMFKYETFFKKDSLYNTPPAFNIYMVGKVAAWIKSEGGLAEMAKRNKKKADRLYGVIDASNGFYRGHAEKESRSFMNVTFRLPSEELEKTFVAEALAQGLGGVKGHRSVGGMRASIYNAMTYEGVDKLASFMEDFQKTHA